MNIIGLDICADIPSMDPNATEDDLLATVKLVEAAGGEMVAAQGYALASLALLEGLGAPAGKGTP